MSKSVIDYNTIYFWDIETSKVIPDQIGEDPIQVVYLSNILEVDINNGKILNSSFQRNLDEVIEYFESRSSKDREIKVYSHNLGYELEFLLRHTGANGLRKEEDKIDAYNEVMESSILRDRTAPLSIYLDVLPFVNFRDSYALFNKSVKQLGKDLINRGINLPKLDYNYKTLRLPWDKLEQLDFDYNERDNVIVAYSIYFYLKDNGITLDKIPLTFTSATKKNRKKYIETTFGKNSLSSLNIKADHVVKDYGFYDMSVDVYQGGLTTCTPNILGKPLKDVYSADLKSDYPSQMLRRYFPNFTEENTYYLEGDQADEFYHEFLHLKELSLDKCCCLKGYMGTFVIDNLEIKDDRYFLPLNYSHCNLNPRYTFGVEKVNGKIRKAERVTVRLNDIDLLWLNKAYYYDNIEVLELWATDRSRQLNVEETSFILKNFDIKENIDKEKYPLEYALSKVNINSMYGVKVQKPIKDRYVIENGKVEVTDFNRLLEVDREKVYNRYLDIKGDSFIKGGRFSGNFDIFTDGIYITSYARLELIEFMVAIVEEGFLPVYTDTDSVKFTIDYEYFKKKYKLNNEKSILKKANEVAFNVINEINENVVNENRNNDRFIQYYNNSKISNEQYSKILKLGIWEIESLDKEGNISPYPFFKTLGAKKYCYIDNGKIKTTIAGCSKEVSKYIQLYADNNNLDYSVALNEIFDSGTLFDETVSGRTSAVKERRERIECEHLTYNGKLLNSYGGIVINDVTYFLNIGEEDSRVLGGERFEKPVRKLNNKGELQYYEYECEE